MNNEGKGTIASRTYQIEVTIPRRTFIQRLPDIRFYATSNQQLLETHLRWHGKNEVGEEKREKKSVPSYSELKVF